MDLTGPWVLDTTAYMESYSVSTTVPGASWSVDCVGGPCSAWTRANISSTGVSSVLIHFDSGISHTGIVSEQDLIVRWEDASSWLRASDMAKLNVHIVMHSHNDPGWRATYWDLYNASHPGINDYAVRDIYSSVVRGLAANASRTFGAELTIFWSAWFAEASDDERNTLRALISSGQLEFTGGGWTQNDEAITSFYDVVDQTTLGHLWAQSALGSPRPTTAWQADPFG